MKRTLGPVLHLEQATAERWRFSVHVVVDSPDAVPPAELGLEGPDGPAGPPELVARFEEIGRTVWCWVLDVPRRDEEYTVGYTLRGGGGDRKIEDVSVPARERLPRIAAFSCNGFSTEALARDTKHPNLLWTRMRDEHERGVREEHPDRPSGVQVLLGGGDQLYADSLSVLKELDELSDRRLARLRSSAERRRRALREYVELYESRWSQEEVAHVMARVPGVYMWDDHDIFDGWGSHREEVQGSEAYLDVFAAAREAFAALQLGGGREGRRAPLLFPFGTGADGPFPQRVKLLAAGQEIEIHLLDQRSERTPKRVMSERQWSAWKTLLADALADEPVPRHLLVVTGVPVVHLRFKAVSWILRNMVPGVQEMEDDLLDQWEHPAHAGERERLIMTLLDHQRRARRRVTVISGDVHCGALGSLRSTRPEHREAGDPEAARILQITTSGIVHPSPNSWQRWVLELLGAEGPDEVTSGVTSRLLPIDPATERLWSRNFLLVDVEPAGGGSPHQLWARFVAEDREPTRMITIPPYRP